MADTGAFAYDVAAVDLALGDLRWSDGEFGVVLVNSSYQPQQAKDTTLRDVGSARVSDPVPLKGRSVDDAEAGRVCLRASAVRFSGTFDFHYAVIFNSRTDRLVAYSDLGPQRVTNGIAIVDFPNGEVCEFVVNG